MNYTNDPTDADSNNWMNEPDNICLCCGSKDIKFDHYSRKMVRYDFCNDCESVFRSADN